MPDGFEQRMSRLTDSQLLDVITHSDEYVGDALTAAQAELEKRGGSEAVGTNVEQEDEGAAAIPCSDSKAKGRWGPVAAFAVVLTLISGIGGKLLLLQDTHEKKAEKKTKVQAALAELARDLGTHLPKTVDEFTRLDGVSVSAGALHYTITILSFDQASADLDSFRQRLRFQVRKGLHGNARIRRLMDLGVAFEYSYRTEEGEPICNFTIGGPEE